MRDHNGQALAFVYCEDEPGRRSTGKLLTRDEVRRIAANIAKLPELLRRKDDGPWAPRRARNDRWVCVLFSNWEKWRKIACMILDWTNWTFWLITLALVAFGFCLRDLYEQWYFRKVRKEVRDEVREVHDLTQRLQAATERLNKANADAEAARLRSRPK